MTRFSALVATATLVVAPAAAAAAANAGNFSFLVMGDWGGVEAPPWTTAAEISTAKGMGQLASQLGSKFALAIGDNFYSHGITAASGHGCTGDEHSPRFANTFENVFTAPSLQADAGFEFFVVAGNHDHGGNVSAQIAYSGLNKRWTFPDYYYTFTKPVDAKTTIQFVYIDTVILTGNSDLRDPTTGEIVRELRGSELPGPADKAAAATQIQWLESTLKASTADYLIVAGHYPVWSICEHGPTPMLLSQVKPLLEKYKATAWMNGHDHCEEYIRENTTDVDYHNIGSAHSNDPSTAHAAVIPAGSLKYHAEGKLGGFASVTATATGLVVTHRDGDGTVHFVTPSHAPRSKAWLARDRSAEE